MITNSREYSITEIKDLLVIRDITENYKTLRNRFNPTKGNSLIESDDDDEPLMSKNENNHFGNDIELSIQPKWKLINDEVKDQMEEIYKRIEDLKQLHKIHTTHKTGKSPEEKAEEKRNIEIETQEISRLFKEAKNSINSLKLADVRSANTLMIENLQKKLISELNETYKVFRDCQRVYLKELSILKNKRKEISFEDEEDKEENERLDDIYRKLGGEFSDDQMRQVMLREKRNIRRDKELKEILNSILELQGLFEDFHTLVVEQGTILDRIDRHIEKAQENVKKGKKNLIQAEKHQKCGKLTICLLFLVVAVLCVVVGLVIKFGIKIAQTASSSKTLFAYYEVYNIMK